MLGDVDARRRLLLSNDVEENPGPDTKDATQGKTTAAKTTPMATSKETSSNTPSRCSQSFPILDQQEAMIQIMNQCVRASIKEATTELKEQQIQQKEEI